jgi:PAS domain S-box-containing protein
LAINEQQLNLIYNSSSDILFLLEVESVGRYKFMSINNAFKIATGLTSEQILDKYVEEVIPEPSLSLVLMKYKEAIETKRTLQWEEVSEYPSGVKTGLINVTPVFDPNKKCIRLVGSVHDITDNKRSETELKEKNEQLRELSAYLQEIREDERAHIAREIHDELGDRLTGIRLDISWMQSQLARNNLQVTDRFPALIQLVDDTIQTVRKISTELRPSILDDFGLVDALEWQAAEFEKRTGISCTFKSFIKNQKNNKKIEVTLFRIFQESLTNILRHSKAKNVRVQLLDEEGMIELNITDDGIGMDLEAVKGKRTLGLIGMKERVLMVDGEFSVLSETGKGTAITVSVPYLKELNK